MSFEALKKSSNQNIQTLTTELEKLNKNTFKDDRVWSVERDKVGNGFAIIRLLPACEGESVPWVQVYSHSVKGPSGQWYIENCPTTLGYSHKCPVCQSNSTYWNSGIESDKTIARDRKRKQRYYSNVLIISDPANKENEGKVMLFNYGSKIFEKIKESMQPKFPGEVPINPFDFWNGRNLRIKVKTVAGYPNYDECQFDAQSALLNGDDNALKKIWASQHKLMPFIDPSQFKSFDDLQTRLNEVLKGSTKSATQPTQRIAETVPSNTPPFVPSNNQEPIDNLEYLKKMISESDE